MATRCSPTSTVMSSSLFAAGSGARFVGVRRRLLRCERVSVLRAVFRSVVRGVLRSGPARPTSGDASSGSSELSPTACAAPGFFLPRPPRLPRRRLFLGPSGASCACVGSGTCVSGGDGTSMATASGAAASSSCFLPTRNQRSAKVGISSFDRARAPESHRQFRPRAAWIQDIGQHDLPQP